MEELQPMQMIVKLILENDSEKVHMIKMDIWEEGEKRWTFIELIFLLQEIACLMGYGKHDPYKTVDFYWRDFFKEWNV